MAFLLQSYISYNLMVNRFFFLFRISMVWLLAVGLSMDAVNAQTDLLFEHFNTKQGLISNEVHTIVQDKKGYIWIGSPEGISRFDGIRFVNFHFSNERTSYAVVVDSTGTVWAADHQAVYRYDTLQQKFNVYVILPTTFDYKHQNERNKGGGKISLLSYRGWLWLTNNDGLYKIKNKKCFQTSLRNTLHTANVKVFTDNSLLLTTYYGVYLYDIVQNQYRILPQVKQAQSVFLDSLQRLWWGDMGYLYRLDADNTVKKWLIKLPENKTGNFTNVTFIEYSPIGQPNRNLLWVGSFGFGIYQFDLQTEQFVDQIHAQYGIKGGLSSDYVSKLMVDKDQNVWIGTSNGVYKYSPHLFRFNTQEFAFFYELGIERLRQIIAVPDRPHVYWIFTASQGFFLYDAKKKKVLRSFLTDIDLSQRSDLQIFEAKLDRKQVLWVSLPKAILRLDPNTFKMRIIPLPFTEKGRNSIDFDDLNTIGIGCIGGRVFFLNTKTFAITAIPPKHLRVNGKNPETVFDILWDKHRRCWWFSTDNGLFRYRSTSDKTNQVYTDFAEKLALDSAHNLWFTNSNNQLVKLTPETGEKVYFKPTLSPENFKPKGLVADRNGVLWMNTFKGLYAFSPQKRQFQAFTEADGLQSDISNGFLYDDGTGRIYLNYSHGYSSFDPLQTVLPRRVAMPEIIVMKVNDSVRTFSGGRPVYLRKPTLTVDFEFTHLDYTQSAKTNFYYKLEGFDNKWKFNGTKRNVTFNNLDNGNYILNLYAVNSAGQVSPASKGVSIVIWQPFWEKPWFWWLFGFVMSSIAVWGILHNRYQQQLKLLQLRTNIARDLHDDMGSYLSSISIMSQNVEKMAQKSPEKANESLKKIGETARKVMDSMSEIVWSVSPEYDSMEHIIGRMKDAAGELFSAQDTFVNFDVPTEVLKLHLPLEKRRDFFLIYKEALTNAAKYAHAKRVTVRLQLKANHLILSISDDGVGFDLLKLPPPNGKGNGLKNMQGRAKKLGGKLQIDTHYGMGSTILLKFAL